MTACGPCLRGRGSPRIVILSFAVRAWLARGMLGPFIMVDELIYSEMAKSFASDLSFAVRGVPVRGYGAVYPILISPALRALRPDPGRLRGGQDDQQPRHVARRRARLPPRPPGRRQVARAARGAARGRGAVDGLHGDRDDRERLLPGLPARRARARGAARAALGAQPRALLRGARARVPDPVAGDRGRRGGRDGTAPARPVPARRASGRRSGRTAGSTRSSSAARCSSSPPRPRAACR